MLMQMRIVHLADLHLGTELYGHYDAATGSSTRLADFGAVMDVAVERAIRERADLFLFAGDAYKTRDPSPTQQRELAMRLRRLLEAGVPVFLLTGNHDMPNAVARATSLDIFGALSPAGFTVASRPGLHTVQTASGPLYVVAVPWITRSAFFARDENKNLPPDELQIPPARAARAEPGDCYRAHGGRRHPCPAHASRNGTRGRVQRRTRCHAEP